MPTVARMTDAGLIAPGDLDAPFANVGGSTRSRRQYIADVAALAERLPSAGAMLNLSVDRYRFAVGLGAALLRGHTSLLPPNHVAETVARLRERFAGVYALVEGPGDEHGLPTVRHASAPAASADISAIPALDPGLIAAYVLTSGSTGEPVPHAKPWGLLVRNARAEASRLAAALGRVDLAGVTVVATVPAQHMYGFESSVLIALHGGAVLDAERPFFPADIVAALARVAAPRVLVTTPFHLKTVLDAGLPLPPMALVISATAPLSPQLAARAEQQLGRAAARDLRLHRGGPGGDPADDRGRGVAHLRRLACRRRRRRRPRQRRPRAAADACSPTCSRSSTPRPSACSAVRTT